MPIPSVQHITECYSLTVFYYLFVLSAILPSTVFFHLPFNLVVEKTLLYFTLCVPFLEDSGQCPVDKRSGNLHQDKESAPRNRVKWIGREIANERPVRHLSRVIDVTGDADDTLRTAGKEFPYRPNTERSSRQQEDDKPWPYGTGSVGTESRLVISLHASLTHSTRHCCDRQNNHVHVLTYNAYQLTIPLCSVSITHFDIHACTAHHHLDPAYYLTPVFSDRL
jgi:hypothetical protein